MKGIPTHDVMCSNIRAVYEQATPDECLHGAAWYPEARYIVADWSLSHRLPAGVVACVIAAISPQCEWTRNLIIADDILSERPPTVRGCLPKNHARANSIVQHARLIGIPAHVAASDYVTTTMATLFPHGPKVQRFAHNLLTSSDDRVTIDTHAGQIALGTIHYATVRERHYPVIESAYVSVARQLGIGPQRLQATTWLAWKRIHPTDIKRASITRQNRVRRSARSRR